MGYCDVAVRGSERYRRCALELDIAIFVLRGLTSAARQMGVLKSPAGDPIAYLIRGAVIALRSEDSANVMMKKG